MNQIAYYFAYANPDQAKELFESQFGPAKHFNKNAEELGIDKHAVEWLSKLWDNPNYRKLMLGAGGAALGGTAGYALGGKKGALVGAGLGGLGGYYSPDMVNMLRSNTGGAPAAPSAPATPPTAGGGAAASSALAGADPGATAPERPGMMADTIGQEFTKTPAAPAAPQTEQSKSFMEGYRQRQSARAADTEMKHQQAQQAPPTPTQPSTAVNYGGNISQPIGSAEVAQANAQQNAPTEVVNYANPAPTQYGGNISQPISTADTIQSRQPNMADYNVMSEKDQAMKQYMDMNNQYGWTPPIGGGYNPNPQMTPAQGSFVSNQGGGRNFGSGIPGYMPQQPSRGTGAPNLVMQ